MDTHHSFGYKNTWTKWTFVSTGIFLLLLLNGSLIVFFMARHLVMRLVFLLLVIGWLFWKLFRLLTKLSYTFAATAITITLPNAKKIVLAHQHIAHIAETASLPRRKGRGIIAHPWSRTYFYTTANSHLLCITMDDGTLIYISPKTYPKTILSQ